MSVQSELNRIEGAKDSLITVIKNRGVDVPDSAKIDELPPLVDEIRTIKLETLAVSPMTNAEINANLVSGAFVKVAENYVTLSDLANGATVNGSAIPSSNFYELFEGVISTQQMQFISVLPVAVGKDLDGIVFNESGTYVLAQSCQSGIEITIPNFKFVKKLEVVERGTTTLTSRRNTSNNTIVFTAENNQKTGYAAGGKSTATKTVSLSVSGNTATATDGSISISVDVPTAGEAVVDTCSIEFDTTNIGATLIDGRKITIIYTVVDTQGEWVSVSSNLLTTDDNVTFNRIAYGSYLVVIMPDGVKAIPVDGTVVYEESGRIFVYDCRPSQGGTQRVSYLLDD